MELSRFLVIAILFAGCAGNQEVTQPVQPFNAVYIDVPQIDPETIGDVRVAIVTRHKMSNVILVNRSNRKYLYEENQSKPRRETPTSALKYRATLLPFDQRTELSILEDDAMAQILGLLDKCRYYGHAVQCTVEQVGNTEWPTRDTVVVEKNGQIYALTREERQLDVSKHETEANRSYRIIKNNILLMKYYGYRPINIQQRILK